MWKKLHRNLSELSKPEMDLLQKTFVRMDIDGDGKISLKDLHILCSKLNYTPAKGELETMIWEVDETLDSTVGWDEFSLAYRYAMHEPAVSDCRSHSTLALARCTCPLSFNCCPGL